MKRLVTFTTTTSYQNAAALLASVSNPFAPSGVRWINGTFRVPVNGGAPIRISIAGADAGDDDLSALYEEGEYMSFDEVYLTNVWIKSVGGASALELEGTENA